MKALVVDDEAPARLWLTKLLRATQAFSQIEQAQSCAEAKHVVAASPPDVIFLDVGMPRLSGMDFAIQEALPPVIFVIAHEQFAVQAFEAQAIDYLLKPVAPRRLAQAMQRLKHYWNAGVASLEAHPRESVRIAASYRNEVHLIDSHEINFFEADGGYANFRHGGFEYVIDESLNSLEKRLGSRAFLRVGRHALVNLRHITALLQTGRQLSVRLRGGATVVVSRRSIAELRQRMGSAILGLRGRV